MGYLILSPKGIFFSLQVYLEEETCLLLLLFFSPLISSSSTSTRRIKNKMKKIFVLKVSSCGLWLRKYNIPSLFLYKKDLRI